MNRSMQSYSIAIRGCGASVRSTLYMAAFNATRHNDVIRSFADRLSAAGHPVKSGHEVVSSPLSADVSGQVVVRYGAVDSVRSR